MAHPTPGVDDRTAAREMLTALCETGQDTEATVIMERLFSAHVQPWCREVVRRTLSSYSSRATDREDEAAEIESEVLLQLATRLFDFRSSGTAPVEDLRSYITAAVQNTCHMRLRARHPRRTKLQNRIRYLLRNDARFALWRNSDGESLAGLKAWSGQGEWAVPQPLAFPPAELPALIEHVLRRTNCAVRLSALVSYAADALGIVDPGAMPLQSEDDLPARGPIVVETLVHRQNLATLWREVMLLPENQRSALLLNLRDAGGHGVIELIPAAGVATFDELATALSMSPDSLAAVWNQLPFDDAHIAEALGLTRQQIINLRKSARERLSRKIERGNANTGRISASLKEGGGVRRAGRAIRSLFSRGQDESHE
ncbi:MAG: hypothetical protein KGN84_04775 [Acidobacteriota bacterium]|nr:hypothetical protein [Acidobacteriota bacterium]